MAVATRKKLTVQPKEGLTLEAAFEQFVQSKVVMNTSAETVKHYRNVFKYFTEFFGAGRLCAVFAHH